jgi:hypothetical protein
LNTKLYRVRVIDPAEQAIKINPGAPGFYADNGSVACSHIELTDAGRPHVRNNCYTGGVDAHQARGWTVRDNWIGGFWCASGLSEHGIHFWTGSRDTIIERNTLVNNARGIGCGLIESGTGRTYADNPCPTASGYVDHYAAVVRNNVVFANRAQLFASQYGFDCGICINQTCGATVVHNTVVSTQAPFSSIEWRFGNTVVDLRNNLVSHNLRDRGGVDTQAGNVQSASLALFEDGANGDLHLMPGATAAIDQGAPVAAGVANDDVDGESRPSGAARDVGADELIRIGMPTNETIAPIGGAAGGLGDVAPLPTIESSREDAVRAPDRIAPAQTAAAESLVASDNAPPAQPETRAITATESAPPRVHAPASAQIDDPTLVGAAPMPRPASAAAPQLEEAEPEDERREQADGGAREAFWLFGLTAVALLVGEGAARIVGRARRRPR